jgi:uncharacterized protein (TIGR03086 family)
MPGVRPEHLSLPTPCAGWSVRDLIDHLVDGTGYLLAGAGAPPIAASRGTAEDAPARFVSGFAAVLDAVAAPEALTRRCVSPLGFEWSVAEAVAGTFMDVLIHGWDLATATGQDAQLEPDLVQACWDMFVPEMPARGREAGLIGAEVPVPADAPLSDRLLGAMGRRP